MLTCAPAITQDIYCEQPYCSADGNRLAMLRSYRVGPGATKGGSMSPCWATVAGGGAVRDLLARHRDAALHAFHETLEHRFPGTADVTMGDSDD